MNLSAVYTLPIAFLLALEETESGGRWDAVGDNGASLGALQVSRAAVVDVNQTFGTTYRWTDGHDRDKARAICTLYLLRYATEERLGHPPTFEDGARIWNGGPNGFKNPVTAGYWKKVEFTLVNQNGKLAYRHHDLFVRKELTRPLH